MKKFISVFMLFWAACGDGSELETGSSMCVYKPVGYCEPVSENAVKWTIWESESRLSDEERSLLRRVAVMSCEECIGQSDVYACEKHNITEPCHE